MFKVILSAVLLSLLCILQAFSQVRPSHGIQFVKRVENNTRRLSLQARLSDGSYMIFYNLESKTGIEKLLFGATNSPVEFIVKPEFEAAYGFRIIRDLSLKTSVIECLCVSNYKQVQKELTQKYPSIGFSEDPLTIDKEVLRQSAEHNLTIWEKQREESLKLYKVETKKFAISDRLADAIHEKIVWEIDNFDSKPEGRAIECSVIFRCVVENEVRTLLLKDQPQGHALRLYEVFQQIINDVQQGKVDETKYLKLLEEIAL